MSEPIPGPPQHAHNPWAPPSQDATRPARPEAGPEQGREQGRWPVPQQGPYGPVLPGPPPPAPPYGWGLPVPAPGPVAAPPGAAYHEQGRNGRQRGGARVGEFFLAVALMVAGLVLALGGSAVIGAVLGLDSAPDDSERFFADPLLDNAVMLVALALWTPAVLIAVRACGGRPAGTLASVTGRLRWGWLGRCFGLAAAVLVLQNLVLVVWSLFQDGSEAVAGDFPGWPALLLSLAVLWALVPFQAAAEEFVFRGWLAQLFGGFLRSPWPGVAVASVLFALAHGFGQLSGFLLLCYSAAWWGWLTIRTGGLEAVIAAHTVNNLIAFSLSAVFGELSDQSTAADAPWEALVAELVFTPVFCLLAARLADRRKIAARTPELAA
ncbi:CPBP family intramembrane glutamic endopeptidase [Streptomyces sp. NPDC002073]|uniref:CPBP family intramembrane glutamic endopeptidase n=1 Tax=Streptomyces sp. NBC_00239 TaxID=2903640 RepID=UPI002E2BBC63|nr:type II CAAX endopeptidase family protein [Streptomyces sp. NBC_00239]